MCTTSSTTSMAGTLERRAEIPRLRQRVRSCFASSWRSSGRLGSTPAPPCTAIAQPPIFFFSLLYPDFLSLDFWACKNLSLLMRFYRQPRTSKFYVLELNFGFHKKGLVSNLAAGSLGWVDRFRVVLRFWVSVTFRYFLIYMISP